MKTPEPRPGTPPPAGSPYALERLRAAAAALRSTVRRLPTLPPSWLAARALDRLLLPRLTPAQRTSLAHRIVEVEVVEPGLRVRLRLDARGFAPAGDRDPAALRIRATANALWRLVRGEDDADRLFFERALVMEGDTAFGVELKHALDAVGPLLR